MELSKPKGTIIKVISGVYTYTTPGTIWRLYRDYYASEAVVSLESIPGVVQRGPRNQYWEINAKDVIPINIETELEKLVWNIP